MQLTIGVHQEIGSIHLLFHLFYLVFTASCMFHRAFERIAFHIAFEHKLTLFPDSLSCVTVGFHLPILLWKLLISALFSHSCHSRSMWISAVKFCLVLPWMFPSRMKPWTLSFLKDSGPYYRISHPTAKSDPASDLRNSQM